MQYRTLWLSLCLLLLGLGLGHGNSAQATLYYQQEGPRQQLEQSRGSLRDTAGHSWQVTCFKRTTPTGVVTLNLRLVGFPDQPGPLHPQAMSLRNAQGQVWEAPDVTATVGETFAAQTNVGQYDVAPIIDQLSPEVPTYLEVLLVDGGTAKLRLTSALLEEWRLVAAA